MDALAALAGYDDEEPAAPVAAAPRKAVPQVPTQDSSRSAGLNPLPYSVLHFNF